MVAHDLVQTGISGLDDILFGGIPRGNVILLEGSVGTGKTTTGVEFVYRGASQFGEPGIIVLFEVSPDKVTRDAARFASSSSDGTARVWTRTGEPVAILRGHERVVWDVVFSADGRRLFTAGDDGVIRRWFVDDAELLAAARRLAFRPLSAPEIEQYAPHAR